MKRKLQSILLYFRFKLFTFYIQWILKVRMTVRTVIFQRLYLDACEQFPRNKLAMNRDLASSVVQGLLDLEQFNLNVCEEDRKKLINLIRKDEWVNCKVSDFHRLTAFYYSYGNSLNLHTEQIETSMSKARESKVSCQPLEESDVKQLHKEVKRERKLLGKRIGVANKLKVDKEKQELISPITITATHFSVALTLMSTLFLISGFVYTKVFFYWFDVNVGDFYTIQDYLASSIDVISATAFSAFVGLVSITFGLSCALNDELHDEQFDEQTRKNDYVWPFILITSVIGLAVSVYFQGYWPSVFIYPLALSVSMYLYIRLPIWKYIENRASVGVVCLVVLFFFLSLGFKVKENIERVLYSGYESHYTVTLDEKYSKYSGMLYLMNNSNFLFLLDAEDKKVIILPKTSIRAFEANG